MELERVTTWTIRALVRRGLKFPEMGQIFPAPFPVNFLNLANNSRKYLLSGSLAAISEISLLIPCLKRKFADFGQNSMNSRAIFEKSLFFSPVPGCSLMTGLLRNPFGRLGRPFANSCEQLHRMKDFPLKSGMELFLA